MLHSIWLLCLYRSHQLNWLGHILYVLCYVKKNLCNAYKTDSYFHLLFIWHPNWCMQIMKNTIEIICYSSSTLYSDDIFSLSLTSWYFWQMDAVPLKKHFHIQYSGLLNSRFCTAWWRIQRWALTASITYW